MWLTEGKGGGTEYDYQAWMIEYQRCDIHVRVWLGAVGGWCTYMHCSNALYFTFVICGQLPPMFTLFLKFRCVCDYVYVHYLVYQAPPHFCGMLECPGRGMRLVSSDQVHFVLSFCRHRNSKLLVGKLCNYH